MRIFSLMVMINVENADDDAGNKGVLNDTLFF